MKPPANSVLFLCTGNYYRSRFAEEWFNHVAALASLDWRARSAALALERGAGNVGPMSPHATAALMDLGAIAARSTQFPRQCRIDDLEAADLIVALQETEHRPLLAARFPEWVDRAKYWDVRDVHECPPTAALATIRSNVSSLVAALQALNRDT